MALSPRPGGILAPTRARCDAVHSVPTPRRPGTIPRNPLLAGSRSPMEGAWPGIKYLLRTRVYYLRGFLE